MPKKLNRTSRARTSLKTQERSTHIGKEKHEGSKTRARSSALTLKLPKESTWQWNSQNAKQFIALPKQTDLTVIYDEEGFNNACEGSINNPLAKANSELFAQDIEGSVKILTEGIATPIYESSARFSIVKCNSGKNIGVTMRLKTEIPEHLKKSKDKWKNYEFLTKIFDYKTFASEGSEDPKKNEPQGSNRPSWIDPSRNDKNPFIVQNYDIAKILWEKVTNRQSDDQKSLETKDADFEINESITGLIVIAGATNSGKSELARSIIGDYLQRRRIAESNSSKILNLVTLEDPVEEWLSGVNTTDAIRHFYNMGVCYMPRRLTRDTHSLTRDTDSLESALRDSKRQSPACFYVGEVRSKDDWKSVIEFASSGHLIVVTTHATNLRETIQRILTSCDADTPQRRKIVADSLCAVIHAKFLSYERNGQKATDKKKHKVQMPSAWIANSRSRNELVRDGLTSIIGNNSNCMSREQFAERTLRHYFSPKLTKNPLIDKDEIKTGILPSIKKQDIKELIG